MSLRHLPSNEGVSMHTLILSAQVDLLCRQVDLLFAQVDLLSAAHSCADLQQLTMVETDKKRHRRSYVTHTHSAGQQRTIHFNGKEDPYFMHKTQYTLDIERDREATFH